ncbi:MAG: hypothetical protein M1818_005361 [Claussenomyces sp. TS43310]|nr:MAG: hypothetical protein M1818_005361 [Claussenomyces sp. TS43310]
MAFRRHRRTQDKSLDPKPFLRPGAAPNDKSTHREALKHPKEQSRGVKQAPRSTAQNFNHTPFKQVYGRKNADTAHRRRPEPDHPLFLDYQDKMDAYRADLSVSTTAALAARYEDLSARIDDLVADDASLQARIAAQRRTLAAPLADELISTERVRSGITITEVHRLGDGVAALKALLADKDAAIAASWRQWDAVQAELCQLRRQVLGGGDGGDADDAARPPEGPSFARQMDAWDEEAKVWARGMQREIEDISTDAVAKMVAAEKENDVRQKHEQAAFFATFLNDHDDDDDD